jgi:hypothetical protein
MAEIDGRDVSEIIDEAVLKYAQIRKWGMPPER